MDPKKYTKTLAALTALSNYGARLKQYFLDRWQLKVQRGGVMLQGLQRITQNNQQQALACMAERANKATVISKVQGAIKLSQLSDKLRKFMVQRHFCQWG